MKTKSPAKALFREYQGKGFAYKRLLSHESACVSWYVIGGKILKEALQCSLPASSCLQANGLGAIARASRARTRARSSFSDFIFNTFHFNSRML